jgi:hypothetical protein
LIEIIKGVKPEQANRIIFVTGDAAGKETVDFLRATGIYCISESIA